MKDAEIRRCHSRKAHMNFDDLDEIWAVVLKRLLLEDMKKRRKLLRIGQKGGQAVGISGIIVR